MSWIDKLERKFGRLAIPGLMKYIVALSGVVYIIYYVFGASLVSLLQMDPGLVLRGQVWRLFSYIIVPPDFGIFGLLVLYFYYIIGTSLESAWGSFRFNLYYLFGMIGTTIAVFITGGTTTATYVNLSLFLAYAKLFPDEEILLFFFLPIKVKYLGYLNWALIIIEIITGPIPYKIAAIVSIINYFVFFGRDILEDISMKRTVSGNRQKFRKNMPHKTTMHRCTVCGITEKDDPDMEFRYCSECDGAHEYCMKHLKNHAHIKNIRKNDSD